MRSNVKRVQTNYEIAIMFEVISVITVTFAISVTVDEIFTSEMSTILTITLRKVQYQTSIIHSIVHVMIQFDGNSNACVLHLSQFEIFGIKTCITWTLTTVKFALSLTVYKIYSQWKCVKPFNLPCEWSKVAQLKNTN